MLAGDLLPVVIPSRLIMRALCLGLAALSQPEREIPTHPWRLVQGRYWQIEANAVESAEDTDAREGTRGACTAGMVAVMGAMKIDGASTIEDLQKTTCTEWIDQRYPERCARFNRTAWRKLSEHLPTRFMRFCIDRFEFPNRFGAYPLIDVSWWESAALCAGEGKRLCTEAEWTFACEGEEAIPCPTGYVRDAEVCVIDRPWRDVNERALLPRDGRGHARARSALARRGVGQPARLS